MNRCGCSTPIPEPFEFKIIDSDNNLKLYISKELFPLVNDLQELKDKIVCEYLKIIDNLECGIKLDLGFLLEQISLVEIMEYEQELLVL